VANVIMDYKPFVYLIVLVIIYIFLHNTVIHHPVNILGKLVGEFGSLFRGEWNTGSVNALGLTFVFIFGVLNFIYKIAHGAFLAFLPLEKSQEFTDSIRADTLLFALAAMIILSVLLCVLRDIYKT
jgi:hypothetical protein